MSTNLSSLITNSIPGAQGEKNYLATGASTSQGWTASGAGITVGTDSTAINLPRPNTTLTGIKFTGVSGSTAYAYYRFILDDADVGKTLKIQWDQKPGTAVSSDFKVDVYSFTASDYSTGSARLSLSTDSSAVTAIPSATGTFKSSFTGPAITSKWIEVRIGMNASATHTLYVSDFIVGPGVVQQGAAVGPWATYTPTVTGMGTVSVVYAEWRRNAENIEIRGKITAGTPTAVALKITLPTGYTGRVASGTATGTGSAGADYNGTNYAGLVPIFTSSDNTNIQFGYNNARDVASPVTASSILAPGSTFWYTVAIPCNEFVGSGIVNVVQNDVEYVYNSGSAVGANDTTSFGYGPDGTPIVAFTGSFTRRVRFRTPIQATDQITLEVRRGAGAPWVSLIGEDGQTGLGPVMYQGSTIYGMGINQSTAGGINATDVDVFFGQYGYANGATYGAAGVAWSSYTGWNWRVKKVSGGQAVGFSEVNPGVSAGLVSANGVKGRTDGGTVAAGYIGERISSPNWSQTSCSTTTGDVTNATLALTPGVWRIHVSVGLDVSTGAVSGNNTRCSVLLTDSSNAIVGTAYRSHYLKTVAAVANEVIMTIAFDETISISAAATYKLRCGRTDGAGTGGGYVTPNNDPVYGGSFFAIRIA